MIERLYSEGYEGEFPFLGVFYDEPSENWGTYRAEGIERVGGFRAMYGPLFGVKDSCEPMLTSDGRRKNYYVHGRIELFPPRETPPVSEGR